MTSAEGSLVLKAEPHDGASYLVGPPCGGVPR
jgi:hypothetical protein